MVELHQQVTKETMSTELSIPFNEHIMAEEFPAYFQAPLHLPTYDGTTNRAEHIHKFENIALLHSNGIKCRVFLTALTNSAQQWFDQLSAGVVRSFANSVPSSNTSLLEWPKSSEKGSQLPKFKYFCRYHREYGHDTNRCGQLQQEIERLIQIGHRRNYVDKEKRREQKEECPRHHSSHKVEQQDNDPHKREHKRKEAPAGEMSPENVLAKGIIRGVQLLVKLAEPKIQFGPKTEPKNSCIQMERKALEDDIISDDEMRLEDEGISDIPLEESQPHRLPKRKDTCKRSKVWDHFIAYTDGEGKPRARYTWTSNQRLTYICLTVHYIDSDWKMHKVILNFIPCPTHRGDDVGLLIETCLLDWGVDKVFAITMDNASSNDTIIAYLRRRFINWGTAILDGKYLHMRCVAHIINFIVKDGLKELNESIERVRTVVRYVHPSPARTRKFNDYVVEEKIQSKKSLCLDVPTRWNSVYTMLETGLIFQRVFERYEIYDVDFRNDFMPDRSY
ncbi:UNVERIFIED_CONTAM: Zinc finger BED domain-containing protein RICESLEEPER 2, partial [Sesamum radiatum]